MKRLTTRAGFTLVELLVVVTIIMILAAAALFVLFRSETAAREGKTRARITALHRIVSDVWEGYASRRLPIAPYDPANETLDDYNTRKQAALDELLQMDFPQYLEEIKNPTGTRTAMSEAYSRRLPAGATTKHEPAECLYLIATVAGQGEEFFKPSDVGDVDGDGAPEFVDAWGRPIYMLRSAPGFPSPLKGNSEVTNVWPLIYSGGADKKFGLQLVPGQAKPVGEPTDDNPDAYIDNIHNHHIFQK